jgi:hypothetical protein
MNFNVRYYYLLLQKEVVDKFKSYDHVASYRTFWGKIYTGS